MKEDVSCRGIFARDFPVVPRSEDVDPACDDDDDDDDDRLPEECDAVLPFHLAERGGRRLQRGRSTSLLQERDDAASASASASQRQEQQRRDKDDPGGSQAGPGGHLQREHLSRRRHRGDGPRDDDRWPAFPAATAATASDKLRRDGVLTPES